MKRVLLSLLALTAVAVPLHAQEDDFPPTIDVVAWIVFRETVDPTSGGGGIVFEQITVFDAASPDPSERNLINIVNFEHQEGDIIFYDVLIQDGDWQLNDEGVLEDPEETYIRFLACPDYQFEPPSAPPVLESNTEFVGPFAPTGNFTAVVVRDFFQIPQFLGASQARLRGDRFFDVRWKVVFSVSNEQDPQPEEGQPPIFPICLLPDERLPLDLLLNCDEPCPGEGTCFCIAVSAVESPLPSFSDSNPPPFADAGADQVVATGSSVTLNASNSFEGVNIGFLPSEDIFDLDVLSFSWQWVSGPERVDPVQSSAQSPEASVTLTALGTYVYRVTVDDNLNSPPSTDSVIIEVVSSLPTNRPPRAVITGPAVPVVVGSLITLNGSLSSDPDNDTLTFRWTQVNSLGDPIEPGDTQDLFQALSGRQSSTLTWQALLPGEYFFRLLVDDGALTAAATFPVTIVSSAVSGAQAFGPADDAQAPAPSPTLLSPSSCGLGFAPLLGLGAAFMLLRGTRR